MRWHPLPIDSQVVAALEDRKNNYIQATASSLDQSTHQKIIFKHVCTVLDHAQKIFEMSEQELYNLDTPEIFEQTDTGKD